MKRLNLERRTDEMKRIALVAVIGTIALLCVGCGSLAGRIGHGLSRDICGTTGELGVYPGVRTDATIVFTAPIRTFDGDPTAMLWVPFWMADLPLSAAVDTCLLPHDIIRDTK